MLTRAFILKQAAMMGIACTTGYVSHEPIKRVARKFTHAKPKVHPRKPVRRVARAAYRPRVVYVTRTVLDCPVPLLGVPVGGLLTAPLFPGAGGVSTPPGGGFGGGYFTGGVIGGIGSIGTPGGGVSTPPGGGGTTPPVTGNPGNPGGPGTPPPEVIAAVPEPATWATMIVGLGAVGWQLRRRKIAVAAQEAERELA